MKNSEFKPVVRLKKLALCHIISVSEGLGKYTKLYLIRLW